MELNATNIGLIVGAVVAVATAITKLTPSDKDDKFLAKYVLPIVSYLSVLAPSTKDAKGGLKVPVLGDVVKVVKGLKKAK